MNTQNINLSQVVNAIRTSVVAGAVSGTITLIASLTGFGGLTPINLIDAALVYGLSFGIYKKSRVCAVIQFIYFLISKVLQFSQAGTLAGLPFALIFGFCFYRGVWGTFAYHQLKKLPSDAGQPPLSPKIVPHHPHPPGSFILHLSTGREILLMPDTKLTMHDIPGLELSNPASQDRTVAEVNRNPEQPSVLGLKNLSDRTWLVTVNKTDGQKTYQIAPEKSIKLEIGTQINFAGSLVGEVLQP
jgi:hypothetical protein